MNEQSSENDKKASRLFDICTLRVGPGRKAGENCVADFLKKLAHQKVESVPLKKYLRPITPTVIENYAPKTTWTVLGYPEKFGKLMCISGQGVLNNETAVMDNEWLRQPSAIDGSLLMRMSGAPWILGELEDIDEDSEADANGCQSGFYPLAHIEEPKIMFSPHFCEALFARLPQSLPKLNKK